MKCRLGFFFLVYGHPVAPAPFVHLLKRLSFFYWLPLHLCKKKRQLALCVSLFLGPLSVLLIYVYMLSLISLSYYCSVVVQVFFSYIFISKPKASCNLDVFKKNIYFCTSSCLGRKSNPNLMSLIDASFFLHPSEKNKTQEAHGHGDAWRHSRTGTTPWVILSRL